MPERSRNWVCIREKAGTEVHGSTGMNRKGKHEDKGTLLFPTICVPLSLSLFFVPPGTSTCLSAICIYSALTFMSSGVTITTNFGEGAMGSN